MSAYKLLIGGELVDGAGLIDVLNPATEQVIARSPIASREQLESAIASARSAFASWRQTPLSTRRRLLERLCELIHENSADIARTLTLEQGKPLKDATDEVHFAQLFCRYFASQDLPVELLLEDDHRRVEVHRTPLGVVGAITTWNFPFLIAVYKLAPALLTGNTLVLKPPPSAPLTTLMLGQLAQSIFPPGVVNVIVDNHDLGPALCSHPSVAKISFTGSTATGKKIMASGAATLKRLTLELGGNDAAIVLDDADPKTVAPGIFASAFLNSGQVCIALKRLYVHESIYDALCEELVKLAQRAVVGDGRDPATQFGPIQNRQQYEKVLGFIEDARTTGRIIAGGEVSRSKGYFVPITVVRDITDGERVVDEEAFGPVLPVIRYRELDEAIARANSSPYALGGSVWSGDVERARAVAARLESGTVWVNQHCAFGPNIPMPPGKDSGVGVEWGREGLLEFTRMKVVNINKQIGR